MIPAVAIHAPSILPRLVSAVTSNTLPALFDQNSFISSSFSLGFTVLAEASQATESKEIVKKRRVLMIFIGMGWVRLMGR